MTEPTQKTPKVYDEAQRVVRVFASQGRAVSLADHLPEKYRKRVAALCNDQGVVDAKAPTELVKIMREFGQENKAAVDGLTEDEK